MPSITSKHGSSPLTRGTQQKNCLQGHHLRFIPAYAGNSSISSTSSNGLTVHPRLRGELCLISTGRRLLIGSSPLTRGTRLNQFFNIFSQRFIPAYAGNSLKQGIEHLTNSSKDFLSGKYAKNPETVLNHFKNSSLDKKISEPFNFKDKCSADLKEDNNVYRRPGFRICSILTSINWI